MHRSADTAYKIRSTANARRLLALAVCLLLVSVSVFSAAYTLSHLNHKHDHAGVNGTCSTCAHMSAAANVLTQIAGAAVKAAAAVFCFFSILSIARLSSKTVSRSSLISLKVQLNN